MLKDPGSEECLWAAVEGEVFRRAGQERGRAFRDTRWWFHAWTISCAVVRTDFEAASTVSRCRQDVSCFQVSVQGGPQCRRGCIRLVTIAGMIPKISYAQMVDRRTRTKVANRSRLRSRNDRSFLQPPRARLPPAGRPTQMDDAGCAAKIKTPNSIYKICRYLVQNLFHSTSLDTGRALIISHRNACPSRCCRPRGRI